MLHEGLSAKRPDRVLAEREAPVLPAPSVALSDVTPGRSDARAIVPAAITTDATDAICAIVRNCTRGRCPLIDAVAGHGTSSSGASRRSVVKASRILLERPAGSATSEVDAQEVLLQVVQRPVETDGDERTSSLTWSRHIS